MKVEQLINGSLHLLLKPETPMEKLQVNEMLDRAAKGKVIKLSELPGEVAGLDVSVEVN